MTTPFKTYLQNVGGPISADIGDAGGGVFSGPAPPNPPITTYQTGAVSFDGMTAFMALASLVSTDNGVASFSFWFQFPNGAFANGGSPIIDSAISTFDNNVTNFTNGTAAAAFDNGFGNTAATSFSNYLSNDSASITDKAWHNLIGSVDISGAGAQDYKLDGVDLTALNESFTGTPGIIQFNGLSLNLIGDGTKFPWDAINIADFWFAPGQSLLTAGLISPTTLAKFRNPTTGKPVSLGANGQTPTGTTPAVFFRRAPSAAASTFATNLGSGGGPFTITGTLTSAPTSPTD